MTTTSLSVTIRPVLASDESAWRRLWTGYLDYYETALPEAVYQRSFARVTGAQPGPFRGLLAEAAGRPVGLVHAIIHPSSWVEDRVTYLQDLFTLPEARGLGVARALIEAVYGLADAEGAPEVYWFTQDFNATARRLYDRIGVLTPYIRYNLPLGARLAPPPGVTTRPVQPSDRGAWLDLWHQYVAHYRTTLPDAVTEATFARVLSDDPATMRGLVAEHEGKVVGLVNHVRHGTCWKEDEVTCLQDLFTAPALRGAGIGRALIGAVAAEAARAGAPSVYWITERENATARALYDRIALATPFIQYARPR